MLVVFATLSNPQSPPETNYGGLGTVAWGKTATNEISFNSMHKWTFGYIPEIGCSQSRQTLHTTH